MNRSRILLTTFCIILISTIGWGQLYLKMENVSPDTWGVSVKPCGDMIPSGNTITGSGQITVVIPEDAVLSGITFHSGIWEQNALVKSPAESPGKTYISIGFLNDYPQIFYDPDQETLLFTCKITGAEDFTPHLIENETDPFAQTPNSVSSNPGNELSVIDFGVTPTGYYSYSGHLEQETSGCDDPVISSTAGKTNAGLPSVFTLSPNPTRNWLDVHFSESLASVSGKLSLSTLQGVMLGSLQKQERNQLSMQVGNLPDGLYILSFESRDGTFFQREKFMKQ